MKQSRIIIQNVKSIRVSVILLALVSIIITTTPVISQTTTVTSDGKMTTGSSIITTTNFSNAGTYTAGSSTINVSGNWTNSGTFTANTGTVGFTGTGAQAINNTGTGDFNNLTVNKASGVLSLSSDATVNGTLTLTDGLLSIGASTLTLGSSATVSGTPSATKMIVADGSGVVRKMYSGTGSFTYPVGENTGTAEYSPVMLNFTSGTFSSGSASVKLTDAKHSSNSSVTNFITRYWTVTSSGITGFSCNLECFYVDADVEGSEASMTAAKWDGANWFDLANAPDAANNKIFGTVTSFSDFTAGEPSVLPVELTSFTASLVGRSVLLRWTTATEVNNYGFEIERTSPQSSWETIGFVDGYGTSNIPHDYFFKDLLNMPLVPELLQYRLKQVDRTGEFTYSPVVAVRIQESLDFGISAHYPHPITASATKATVVFTLLETSHARLSVVDALGREIALLVDGMRDRGKHEENFNLSHLPAGMYYYVLQSGGQRSMRQFVIVR